MGKPTARQKVSLLAASTISAHAILLATTPVISRIYTPEEYGVYAQILAVVFVSVSFVSMRWELCLPHAAEGDRSTLIRLAILSTTLGALTVGAFAALLLPLRLPAVQAGVATSAMIFLLAMLQVAIQAKIVEQRYRDVAYARLGQFFILVIVQCAGGGLSAWGLISGHLASVAVGCLALGYSSLRVSYYKPAHVGDLRRVARTYFPSAAWAVVAAGANSIGNHVPVLILTLVSVNAAGQFALGSRAVLAPILAVGLAGAQFITGQIATRATDPKILAHQSGRMLVGATAVAALILAPVVIAGPQITGYALGPNWKPAGEYLQLMAPALLLAGSSSVLALVPIGLGRARDEAIFQISLALVRGVAVACLIPFGVHAMVLAYSAVSTVAWVVYIAWVRRLLDGPDWLGIPGVGSCALGLSYVLIVAAILLGRGSTSSDWVLALLACTGVLALLPAVLKVVKT